MILPSMNVQSKNPCLISPRLIVSAFVLVASSNMAMADDFNGGGGFDIKPASKASRWTGVYGGIAFDLSQTSAKINKGGNAFLKPKDDRVTLGVYIGANRRLGGAHSNWIWGGELGLHGIGADKMISDPTLGAVKFKSNGMIDAAVKLGFGFEKAAFYGKVGLAGSDIHVDGNVPSKNDYRGGTLIGLGAEFAITEKWSTKFEAVSYNFGSKKVKFDGVSRKVDLQAASLSFGLSRKF